MEELIKKISKIVMLKSANCYGFEDIKVGPMKFKIKHWESNVLGNVSLMDAKAALGLMTMKSVIINPSKIDMPLLSFDVVKVMGKYSVYCEIYNTTLNGFDQSKLNKIKDSLKDLEDIPQKPNWYDNIKMDCCTYKKCNKKNYEEAEKAFFDYVLQYCKQATQKTEFTDSSLVKAKVEKNNAYVDGLINNGGPSTDVFIKAIGKEKTYNLFHKVLFG